MRSEIVCKPKRQTTSKGRAMQMNGFLDRRVLNVRRPLKYIIITEVVCRHPLLQHTRRRFYPPSTGGCLTVLYHAARCSARHFGGRGKRRGRCGSPALPRLGAQGADGGARRGLRRFFGGVKNGQILPMGDVPLTGAACLGAEGLPLTGRADFSRLPERRMRQKPPLRPRFPQRRACAAAFRMI